jgi:hypothetical protein
MAELSLHNDHSDQAGSLAPKTGALALYALLQHVMLSHPFPIHSCGHEIAVCEAAGVGLTRLDLRPKRVEALGQHSSPAQRSPGRMHGQKARARRGGAHWTQSHTRA